MNHKLKAFIRVKDAEKRKEIYSSLINNEYELYGEFNNESDYFYVLNGTFIESELLYPAKVIYINCNENRSEDDAISLFLELVKMRDDVDEYVKDNLDVLRSEVNNCK